MSCPTRAGGPGTSEERKRDRELIESSTQVTLIVHQRGNRSDQLKVSLLGDDIAVTAPDFTVRRTFRAAVDGSSLVTTHVDGILGAKLRKTI